MIKARNAEVVKVTELRQQSSDLESTLEFEIDCSNVGTYQTAGNLNLYAVNSAENVRKALNSVGLEGDEILSIEPSSSKTKRACPPRVSARALFERWVDLQGKIKVSSLKKLSRLVTDEDTKNQ